MARGPHHLETHCVEVRVADGRSQLPSRPFTFFEGGMVGHVMFADPFDETLARVVRQCGHSLEGEGVKLHDEGTLVCMGKPHDIHQPFPLHPFSLGACRARLVK